MPTESLKETGARLLALQEVDMQRARIRAQIESLPQKRTVAALRAKQAEGVGRLAQIEERLQEATAQEKVLGVELQSLEGKIGQEQKKIEATTDHREVAALTRELEALAQHKDALEDKSLILLQKQQDLEGLRIDTEEKLAALKAREQSEIAEYRHSGTLLAEELKEQDGYREELAAGLPAGVLERYMALAAEKDGVAVAHYRGGRCLGCSMTPPTGQRALIEASEEIEVCPHCRRLLVVERDDD